MLVFKKNFVLKITIVCPKSIQNCIPNVLFLYYLKRSGGIKRGYEKETLGGGYKKEILGRNGLTQISLSSYQIMKGYLRYLFPANVAHMYKPGSWFLLAKCHSPTGVFHAFSR